MKNFIPDVYLETVYDINLDRLKKNNIKNIFFDVDNTLLTYEETIPSKKSIDFINTLKKKGFNCFLFSNSNSTRINNIKDKYKIGAYTSCMKPLKKQYKKVLKQYKKEECVFIGDQIMTDVYGAKRNDLKVIFVEGLKGKEPITTRFWRFFEKIILKKLEKQNKFKKGKYYE